MYIIILIEGTLFFQVFRYSGDSPACVIERLSPALQLLYHHDYVNWITPVECFNFPEISGYCLNAPCSISKCLPRLFVPGNQLIIS